MLDSSASIADALAPGRAAMEMACRHVAALGYVASDCQVVLSTQYTDSARSEHETLNVLGVPCFEVVTVWHSMTDDHRIEVSTYPRLIAWPELRPAHQLRASLTAGDP